MTLTEGALMAPDVQQSLCPLEAIASAPAQVVERHRKLPVLD